MNTPTATVGDWYRSDSGVLFEVVAIDKDDATIEVQHFDGTVEEIRRQISGARFRGAPGACSQRPAPA